jgi:hypothetical protein
MAVPLFLNPVVAAADTAAQALPTAAVVRLLHNALRVDEACAADIATSARTAATECCAWSARVPGRRRSRSPRPPCSRSCA